ncbi:MAG: hypothetical protein GX625_07175 [Clostridiaceae bacterium]|nr:hypothetical protein [Clostridiaceae bacterium]
MVKKSLLIIITFLILLFVSGCRVISEKPVSPINQSTHNNSQNENADKDQPVQEDSQNENDGKEQPVSDNTVMPQLPVEDKMVTDSQLKISYTEDVLVFTFTDKDVETFFQLVEENDERDLEIQFNLQYKFYAGVRFLAADPLNNQPSQSIANYENHIYNRNGSTETIFAASWDIDAWKVDWVREGNTISVICKAHGLPASEVQGATVDVIMNGLLGYERDITPRRTIDPNKISYSNTLPEGADKPIQISVTSSLSDFKLLSKYEPKSDDYLLLEYQMEDRTNLQVVSYDERGVAIDNVNVGEYYFDHSLDGVWPATEYNYKEYAASSGLFGEIPPVFDGTVFHAYLSKPTLTAKQMYHLDSY